jgi:hypothetical protein
LFANLTLDADSNVIRALRQPSATDVLNIKDFMRVRFEDARIEQYFNPELPAFVPHDGSPAARFRKLKDREMVMGLLNLYGCSLGLVISKYAVWKSHSWEAPAFRYPWPLNFLRSDPSSDIF